MVLRRFGELFMQLSWKKDKKAKLGRTVIIKKLISELPAGVKNTTEKEFRKLRRGLELTGGEIDQIYSVARRAFQDRYGNAAAEAPTPPTELVLPASADQKEIINSSVDPENETLSRMLDDKLEAFFTRERKKQEGQWKKTRKSDIQCYHCGKKGHIQRDCKFAKGAYAVLGENSAVMIKGKINGQKEPMMVDSGAGPCIIDLQTLKNINADIQIESCKRKLHGIGSTEAIGTAKIDVELHPNVKVQQQTFHVVDKLGVVLLGRSFLKKFDSLEINWKMMGLKIDGNAISGSKVINGENLILGCSSPMTKRQTEGT